MIKKGEPFEFLDGDQLQIDQQFLTSLMKKFSDPDKEKVLVLSILGPQSSGKSTILNKIFGCHFWTSVGRCTKGIYLQLLKISEKSYFDDLFDYVLILDTEGLQNPNQNDPEFDKKIALFILAISDIILINVKGDIHSQFKNLVEMCIFTLGQMKSTISSVKQLSWCFNQNNDCKNFAPFLDQIQSIVNNLNLQINKTEDEHDNSNFDYNEVLDLKKENIKILGFASTEQSWRVNTNTGIQEWRQLIVNETFSEEAYLFGVQMIKQFSEKFKAQSDQDKLMSMPSLSQFIQNIESNWQSISRLPDLLEFTELLQYKQDQLMKQQFEIIYTQQSLDFHLKIPLKIQSELPKGKIYLDFFTKCEQQQKQFIKNEIQIIQNYLKEKLLQIKTQNQIQKKIYLKYIRILEGRLQSYYCHCDLVIFEVIKKHLTDFQQKKGFLQIENLVQQISQDNSALQSLKGNPELIKEKFDAKWSEIVNQSIDEQENIFRDFSIAQYQTIYSSFSQYSLKSENQKEFQNKFLKEINKNSPFKKSDNEKQQTYFIFQNEFKKQQQFMCLQKETATIKYQDIFHQKIQDRLKKSSDQNIINMNHYYHYEVQLIHIKKQDFEDYLKSNIFEDFWNFVKLTKQNYQYKDRNAESIVSEFFQLLIFCSVTYDQQQYQNLIKWMQEGGSLKFWKSDEEKFKDQFYKLQKTFKFKNQTKNYVESQEHAKYLSYNYPNLRCEKIKYNVNDEKEFQNLLSEQQRNCIIFLSQKEIRPKKYEHQNLLLYIGDQTENYQFTALFNQNGVKLFELIMDEQKGWIKLYSQIYDVIKLEMITLNSKLIQSDSMEEEEIVSSDMNLIQIIMSKIQQKIIEFNNEFSNFGVILKDVGERCIYYYSIFIIWRFQCYKEWRALEENQQKLKNMKDEQLQKFTADIEQNKSEQSILSAQAIAKNIKQSFLDRFYQDNLEQISKSIMSYNMSCYDFVKQLDIDILEQAFKSKLYSDDDILNYIVDQKQFIEKQVDILLTRIEKKVKTEFENQLRQELKQYMKLIFHNLEIIYNYISKQIEPVKTEEYFDYDEVELSTQNCESQLFQLIQNCIQGDNLNQVNEFKVNYNFRDIFEIKQYSQIRVPIFIRTSNQSEELIKLLKPFIQELYKQIKKFIEKSDNEQIMLRNNFIQHCWNKLKLDMNGCQHSCPMCKRKCDQPNDNNHKHSCRNGHQLRGMNGVIINNYPSLFTCEEIPDEAEITTLETNIVKKWREIQKAYNDWIFKDLKENEIKLVKEKMMNVWNNGIGKLVCNYLKDKFKNLYIIFQKKTELIHYESIHYIIILDDSGSMAGQKWEKAIKGAIDCMKEIEKNPYAKVSVIQFNGDARVVINCEKVDIQKQKGKFNFSNGQSTDFGKAFNLAYKLFNTQNYLNFQKTIFLFYTDGGATYPDQEVTLFCNLEIEKKNKISLICCSETELKQNACLIKITEEFKKKKIFAELKSNVKVNDIQKVFTEIVSQSYHNLKC